MVSRPLAGKLAALAAMRKVLVHDYLDVDRGLIYSTLRHDLRYFERFIAAVLKLV